MAEHTKTPWMLATNDDTLIVTEALDNDGDCFVVADVLNGGMPGKAACVANAAFIVTACNSHAALVEACKAVVNASQAGGDTVGLLVDLHRVAILCTRALVEAGEL